jgi:hypothetical protein
LPCNSFDILRIGDAPLQDCELPVKLLIKVEPDQVDWVDGMQLAQRCRSELQQFGLDDVHCEVLEAQIRAACDSPSSSSVSPTPATSPHPFVWPIKDEWAYSWRKHLLPFTPILGQCISRADTPHIRGSTGLYLRISTKAGTRYADCLLTCRHVLIKNENNDAINLVSTVESTNHEQPIQVIQPANYEEIKPELDIEKALLETQIKRIQEKGTFAKTEKTSRYLADLQQELELLNAFLPYYNNKADDRKIGYIIASPPISAKIEAHGKTICRDWAAIRIDPSKFCLEDNVLPKNQFCIVDVQPKILLGLMRTGQTSAVDDCDNWSIYNCRGKDMLAIEQYITPDSLQREIDRIRRLKNEEAAKNTQPTRLSVFKSGFQSGTTYGHLNEIGSYIKNGLSYSQHLCILSQVKGHAFSDDGDSGSLISMLCRPDGDKRHDPVVVAAGLLWGGCNPTQYCASDITYAIPLIYVLGDVKQFFSKPGTDFDRVEFSNLKVWEPNNATIS